jgi:hypothetical protein
MLMQVLTNTFFPSFRGMIVDTFFIDRDSDLIQGDTTNRKTPDLVGGVGRAEMAGV